MRRRRSWCGSSHGTAQERAEAVDAVLRRGGVTDRWGRFREVGFF
jgi:hypothetical protein